MKVTVDWNVPRQPSISSKAVQMWWKVSKTKSVIYQSNPFDLKSNSSSLVISLANFALGNKEWRHSFTGSNKNDTLVDTDWHLLDILNNEITCSMAFRVFRKRFVLPAIAVTLICMKYFFFGHYTRNSGTITRISTPVSSVENVAIASIRSNAFLAATMINKGRLYPSAVCVVDPAIIECIGMGFAAFLLKTLDHIRFCGFLGIHRPVVYWRACNVVCSRNPRVNSWNWYFEPVNPGLEIQVEKVLCKIGRASCRERV